MKKKQFKDYDIQEKIYCIYVSNEYRKAKDLTYFRENLLSDLYGNRKILLKPHEAEDEHQYLNKSSSIILFFIYLKERRKRNMKMISIQTQHDIGMYECV